MVRWGRVVGGKVSCVEATVLDTTDDVETVMADAGLCRPGFRLSWGKCASSVIMAAGGIFGLA